MGSLLRSGTRLSHVTRTIASLSNPGLKTVEANNAIRRSRLHSTYSGSPQLPKLAAPYSSLAAAADGGDVVQEKWRQKEVAWKEHLLKSGKLNALWVLYMYEENRVPHKMHANGTLYADWHSFSPQEADDFHFFRDVEQKCGVSSVDFLDFVAHLRFKLQTNGVHQGKYSPEVHLFTPPLTNTETNFLIYLCNLQDLDYHVMDDHPDPAGFLRGEKEKFVKTYG